MCDTWSGMTIPSESSQPGSEMDCSTTPQFSAISTHSSVTGSPQAIKEWLMLSRGDSHASLTQSPEESLQEMTAETDGLPQERLFAKYNQSSACWKTFLALFPTDTSHTYSGTWPKWGSMRNGAVYRQEAWEPAIFVNAGGYLPTPAASDNKDRGNLNNPSIQRRIKIGKQVGLSMLFAKQPCPTCVENIMVWPMGWSNVQPLEMGRFQSWLRQHGRF